MLIVFCDTCGMRIQQKDLDEGAVVSNNDRYTCVKCSGNQPAVASPAPVHIQMPAPEDSGRSSGRLTPSKPSRVSARMLPRPSSDKRASGGTPRPVDTRAAAQEANSRSSRTPLMIAGGGGLIFVLALMIMMFKGRNSDVENKEKKNASTVAAVDVKQSNTPLQNQTSNTVGESTPKTDPAKTDPAQKSDPKTQPPANGDRARALPSWMRVEAETESKQPLVGEYVWIDDALPRGGVPAGNTKENAWKWTTTPAPVMGTLAHTFSGVEHSGPGETRQHYFEKCADSLRAGTADTFFAYVYIDPANPPKQIMMQWRFNDSWDHRAYWGENLIPFGQNFSASRVPMGPLPKAGEWVRLEIPAASIGIEAAEERLIGWSFDHWGGNVYWDKAGVVRVPPAK